MKSSIISAGCLTMPALKLASFSLLSFWYRYNLNFYHRVMISILSQSYQSFSIYRKVHSLILCLSLSDIEIYNRYDEIPFSMGTRNFEELWIKANLKSNFQCLVFENILVFTPKANLAYLSCIQSM